MTLPSQGGAQERVKNLPKKKFLQGKHS